MPNYFITKSFRSPNVNKAIDGGTDVKTFQIGDIIAGKESSYQNKTGTVFATIKTDDGFQIPQANVEKYEPSKSGAEAQDAMINAQGEVSKIVNRDYVTEIVETAQKSMKGATIGVAFGIGYAVFFRKRILWSGAICGVVGGLSGYYYAKYFYKKKTITNGTNI